MENWIAVKVINKITINRSYINKIKVEISNLKKIKSSEYSKRHHTTPEI